MMQPLRPRIVRAVFEYVGNHEFKRQDFLIFVHTITRERTVRLAPALAKEIVEVAIKAVSIREGVKVVRWLVGELRRVERKL
jgi:hypothetical protein